MNKRANHNTDSFDFMILFLLKRDHEIKIVSSVSVKVFLILDNLNMFFNHFAKL